MAANRHNIRKLNAVIDILFAVIAVFHKGISFRNRQVVKENRICPVYFFQYIRVVGKCYTGNIILLFISPDF